MESHRIKPFRCLLCNRELDGVTGVDTKSTPVPGSISICAYCGNVAQFGTDKLETVDVSALDKETRDLIYEVQTKLYEVQTKLRLLSN